MIIVRGNFPTLKLGISTPLSSLHSCSRPQQIPPITELPGVVQALALGKKRGMKAQEVTFA